MMHQCGAIRLVCKDEPFRYLTKSDMRRADGVSKCTDFFSVPQSSKIVVVFIICTRPATGRQRKIHLKNALAAENSLFEVGDLF